MTGRACVLRPVLHHLNADSSWLIQLPIPLASIREQSASLNRNYRHGQQGGRKFFNILLDPWLRGPQTDVASWFSTQWHATTSTYQSIAQVSSLAWRVEAEEQRPRNTDDDDTNDSEEQERGCNAIDMVVISHEFTDHCHRETLLELDTDVPVLAPSKAANLVRGFGHFVHVTDMDCFGIEQTKAQAEAQRKMQPEWISVTRLQDAKDAQHLHSAVVMRFSKHDGTGQESVVYTPHGVSLAAIDLMWQHSEPTHTHTLCLIHGVHQVWLSVVQQLNLGGHNGLKLQRKTRAKYWVGTHDEVKIGRGLVGWFLRRNAITIDEALKQEGKSSDTQARHSQDHVLYEEIASCACKILA